MQPCDQHDPRVPERPRTANRPVSGEKWLFGEFGEAPRTLANVDYWCFVISRSVVRVHSPAPYFLITLSHFVFYSLSLQTISAANRRRSGTFASWSACGGPAAV